MVTVHAAAHGEVSALYAGADAFLLEALFRNETWDFMLQPVSRENEDALCQSMIAGCRSALSKVCSCESV